MPDYDIREPRIITPPVESDEKPSKTEGYFRYDPYDPRAADAGGFGFGGTNGSAGGFGAGGMGPQTGEYGSQANYGSGPEYNFKEGVDSAVPEEKDAVLDPGLPPLKSRWADQHVAHAPSHPGPVDPDTKD